MLISPVKTDRSMQMMRMLRKLHFLPLLISFISFILLFKFKHTLPETVMNHYCLLVAGLSAYAHPQQGVSLGYVYFSSFPIVHLTVFHFVIFSFDNAV